MIPEFMAVANGIKTASDMLKGMADLKTFNDVTAILAKVNFDLIAAQSATLQLQADKAALGEELKTAKERMVELDQEVERLKVFINDRANYRLKEVAAGAFAYASQPLCDAVEGETDPAHWLCCQCYGQGFKSILQFTGWEKSNRMFKCHRCQSSIAVHTPSAGVTLQPTRGGRFGSEHGGF